MGTLSIKALNQIIDALTDTEEQKTQAVFRLLDGMGDRPNHDALLDALAHRSYMRKLAIARKKLTRVVREAEEHDVSVRIEPDTGSSRPRWSDDDDTQAIQEGWYINFGGAHPEILVLEANNVLAVSHTDVRRFVYQQAAKGNDLHQRAVAIELGVDTHG